MYNLNAEQRADLIALLTWAGGEHVKQQLGLPSEWDQTKWCSVGTCGTSVCLGGKYMLLHGFSFVADPNWDRDGDSWERRTLYGLTESLPLGSTGRYVAGQLGIHDGGVSGYGHAIFAESNNFDSLIEHAREILGVGIYAPLAHDDDSWRCDDPACCPQT